MFSTSQKFFDEYSFFFLTLCPVIPLLLFLSIFFLIGWFSADVWLSDLGLSLSNEE